MICVLQVYFIFFLIIKKNLRFIIYAICKYSISHKILITFLFVYNVTNDYCIYKLLMRLWNIEVEQTIENFVGTLGEDVVVVPLIAMIHTFLMIF